MRRTTGLRLVLLALCLTGCLFLSACLPLWLIHPVSETEPWTYPSLSTGLTAAPTTGRTTTAPTEVTPAATDLLRPDLDQPDAAFDAQVSRLILDSLRRRDAEVVLDPVFSVWLVDEAQIQRLIDRVYACFTDVYQRHAAFFYLNGSFQIHYTILQSSRQNRISAMKLVPEFWSSTADLTDGQLDQLIRDVDREVTRIAAEIQAQTAEPRRQLTLLHDYLVREIAYDPQADQANNHAGMALLRGITLCQGYAQSFQLIGTRLGHEIRIISGESDGVGHAWNLVTLDGVAYHVDVTHDDPTPDGGRDRPVRHVHLFRSDDIFRTTHTWEASAYPACPEDGAFFYYDEDLVAADAADLKRQVEQFVKTHPFKSGQTGLLERLYTGSDLSQAALEKILSDALQKYASGYTVYYRADLQKRIVLMLISTRS
jgi:transglutaminase-like putative cysteine protease